MTIAYLSLLLSAARITPVVFPPHSEERAGVELGYGIADLAGAELYGTAAYNHVHLKQVLSVARHRGLSGADLATPETSRDVAMTLGASVGAAGAIRRDAHGWKLVMTVFDNRSGEETSLTRDLPADTALAVREGGTAVARAIGALDRVEVGDRTAHPHTESAAAMTAYLSCYAALVVQPMGLRKSHVIDTGVIAAARGQCEEAVRLDPAFSAAWAALSLACSLSMQNEAAGSALEKIRGVTDYLPFAVLAEYWLTTRFNSNAAGAVVLRDAARAWPGALIFLSYLGEHLNITGKYNEALAAWNRYLAEVPHSPYGSVQKGYSMARLGFLDAAIDLSRHAAERDPDSMEIKLELASRLVDARKLDEAAALLEPMVADPRAYGEVVLRLGYVYLLQNNNEAAEPILERALKLATGPSEWRTRGRARYDLAIVMTRAGELSQAEDQLLAAAKEGFVVNSLLGSDPDLAKLKGRRRVAHLFLGELGPVPSVLQASPFPTDAAGQVRTEANRPAAPGFSF